MHFSMYRAYTIHVEMHCQILAFPLLPVHSPHLHFETADFNDEAPHLHFETADFNDEALYNLGVARNLYTRSQLAKSRCSADGM